MAASIERFQREDGDWGFRVVGGNGEIMVQSEGYTRAADASRGAEDLIRAVFDATGVDIYPAEFNIKHVGDDAAE